MIEEMLPYIVLAQGMNAAVDEELEITDQEKRILLGRFSKILRPVCNATDEAFVAGFDAGAANGIGANRSE